MRAFVFSAALGILGCGSAPAPQNAADAAASAPPVAAITLEKAADSGSVDRVGASDGALAPDGTNDLAFVVHAEGPVAALFLVAVDESGKPSGTFQADTLVGDAESPAELGAKPGSGTSGLGVFEDAKILNGTDGALQPLGPGAHALTLYAAPSPALTSATRVRVYLQRPDKTLIAGNFVTN